MSSKLNKIEVNYLLEQVFTQLAIQLDDFQHGYHLPDKLKDNKWLKDYDMMTAIIVKLRSYE